MVSTPVRLTSVYYLFALIALLGETAYGDVGSKSLFIRISSDLSIKLSENPAIFFSENSELMPEDGSFTPHDNSAGVWFPLTNSRQNWIRVVLFNPSDTAVNVFVKYSFSPSEVHVLYRGGNNSWKRKRAGKLVAKEESAPSFYSANQIEIASGTDTIYFYNANTWKKFRLDYIQFDSAKPDSLEKARFFASANNLPFYIFTFVILLIFQIIYVVIQGLYHRKVEYREYIFYLVTLLIYFTVRYEIYFDSQILTGNFPWLRRLLNDLMLILPFVFYLRFGRYFVETRDKYPEMNRKIKLVERVVFTLCVLFVILWFTPLRKYDSIYIHLVIAGCSIYSFRLIYFLFRQRNKQINFFLLGSLSAIIGHIAGTATSFIQLSGWSLNLQPILFTMVGLMFEIFFFNTGLGYKAKSAQDDKVKAQEKLINQLNSNRKMQERLQNMRNRIASDLHDDVGSTLSSIGLYSEVGIQQIDKNPDYVKGILEKIVSSSQRMMTAMNDIVWAIQSRNEKGEGLVERLAQFADERLSALNIKFSINHDKNIEQLNFSLEARRNILLLFKEAVNNAAKYSESPRIDCNLLIRDDLLIMELIDFGVGFEMGEKKFGNGLATMRNRALQLNGVIEVVSGHGLGTTIRLTIPMDEVVLGNLQNGG